MMEEVIWGWPQWYFAVIYVIAGISAATNIIADEKEKRLGGIVSAAMLAFGIYALNVGGFF